MSIRREYGPETDGGGWIVGWESRNAQIKIKIISVTKLSKKKGRK
jgi:hypothetical protein